MDNDDNENNITASVVRWTMVDGKGIRISGDGQRQLWQQQQTRVDGVSTGDNNSSSGRQRMQPKKVGSKKGPPNKNERGVMSANYGLMMPFFLAFNHINQNECMVFACLH